MSTASIRRAPSRIFVTGATGVVGRRAVPLLVARGHQVTAVGRNPAKLASLATMGASTVALDLFDATAVRRAVENHDVVINLATHMPSSTIKMMFKRSWKENDRVRREGSAILVDAALAAGVRRFVQESFAPIYEDGGSRWIDENWPTRPVSYNRTVADAENSAARFASKGGSAVVLRFAWFYGSDNILHDMLDSVRRGWSPVAGDAHAYWSSLAHEDAAVAVVAALEAVGGTYNVCDDEPLTRREFADALAAAIGARSPKLIPHWLGAIGGSTMELLGRSIRMSNAA
ncbi:MAG TPA: NAD(P)H-binding protein, partial [Gemmatimonadaceae bacterium]